jgi:hypothetical protein
MSDELNDEIAWVSDRTGFGKARPSDDFYRDKMRARCGSGAGPRCFWLVGRLMSGCRRSALSTAIDKSQNYQRLIQAAPVAGFFIENLLRTTHNAARVSSQTFRVSPLTRPLLEQAVINLLIEGCNGRNEISRTAQIVVVNGRTN